jgi:hypothetical protein
MDLGWLVVVAGSLEELTRPQVPAEGPVFSGGRELARRARVQQVAGEGDRKALSATGGRTA